MDTQEKAPAIIQTFQAQIKEQAELTLMTATAGRSWSRHNIGIELLEENSKANIRSCAIAGSQQYVDQSSFIHHRSINTSSSQVAHGIATDHAKIVFNGKIQIHRDAQKSQTSQMARHLLLSQQAQVNAKPELFIDADDVKAAHGATVGPMDAEEFFYLQSRGLTAKQARELLGRGFILSVTEGLHSRLQAPLVDSLQAALVSTLDAT